MILSAFVSVCAFISGTINGILGSILQADELSTTVQPTSANLGAHSLDTDPPAENIAILGFIVTAVSISVMVYCFPLKVMDLPTDLEEATGINSVIGRLAFSKTLNISVPTSPVAPTTAIFIMSFYD